MDGPTDRVTYRVACMRLKIVSKISYMISMPFPLKFRGLKKRVMDTWAHGPMDPHIEMCDASKKNQSPKGIRLSAILLPY